MYFYITLCAIPTMSILTLEIYKITNNSVLKLLFKLKRLFPCVYVSKTSRSRHPMLQKPNQLGSSSSSNNFYLQEQSDFSHIWLERGSNRRRRNDLQYKYVIWADPLSCGTPSGFWEHGDKKFLKGNEP